MSLLLLFFANLLYLFPAPLAHLSGLSFYFSNPLSTILSNFISSPTECNDWLRLTSPVPIESYQLALPCPVPDAGNAAS
ncbi:hypothetical protein N7510_002542 [Penicillium lagena]|uniref:uncharacterized protein n=1 Tax=Penicillium lagena TaxID=94218 RepID=UPI00253FDF7C|nr:uncharacterized protein N7510_002542 [Penicillium lagena]KAJ5626233.1 hypothetical protein N7510_002542 [Penicillium lagena]